MARDNLSWGEERIANELLLKLASRRLIHLNATVHPIAAWTLQ
jgi:hypothetical protein